MRTIGLKRWDAMGERDFLLKEEKIDKLPCGRRSTSMRSIAVHTEVNKPDEACASSGSLIYNRQKSLPILHAKTLICFIIDAI